MTKKISVEAKSITDIRGKEQTYLLLGEDGNKVIINVGEKTFKNVKTLLDGGKLEAGSKSNTFENQQANL